MNLDKLTSIEQMEAFLIGNQPIAFSLLVSKDDHYQFVEKILKRFRYAHCNRRDKGSIRAFLQKVSGYSRQQLTRLIARYNDSGCVQRYHKTTNGFRVLYQPDDVRLLAELDKRHNTPNGMMIKKLCERAYHVFADKAYERLAGISVAHIYNLRKSSGYKRHRRHYEKTKPSKAVHIGVRRKPRPEGKPGYIRIDTVHQGDLDGVKGVYHINAVDEVTQFEIVVSVEKISERYLIPVLEQLLDTFPFVIHNFHADNGSEYINEAVERLLNKLLIELTKSRARQSTDNALAEGKNAAIVRKTFGYSHIPQRYAERLNQFNQTALNPYINYHRPCLFPTTIMDAKGKQRKQYKYADMKTPYEKLKSLPEAAQYLKPGLSFSFLDDKASQLSDNQAADRLNQQRQLLFTLIHEDCKKLP